MIVLTGRDDNDSTASWTTLMNIDDEITLSILSCYRCNFGFMTL